MERLKGVEAMAVVYKRFSDGCDVIQCILEFYKEIAELEKVYSSRMLKLLESSNYTFHSNILLQWLGGDPYEEIGTVKHSWQKLGAELAKLAFLHAEKSRGFSHTVCEPLQKIAPQLEEERKRLKLSKQELEMNLRNANRKFQKAKKAYLKVGDNYAQLMKEQREDGPRRFRPLLSLDKRIAELEKEFKEQEENYIQSHRELVVTRQSLDEDVTSLFADIHKKELERVETVAKSLQEFARTLSNTAPVYLESMQQIVLSVNDINGTSDINSFVESHGNLHENPTYPPLDLHPCSSSSPEVCTPREEVPHVTPTVPHPPSVVPDTGQREEGQRERHVLGEARRKDPPTPDDVKASADYTSVGGATTTTLHNVDRPPVINKPFVPAKKPVVVKPNPARHDGGRHAAGGGERRVATEHKERPKVPRARSSTDTEVATPTDPPTSLQQQQEQLLLKLKEKAQNNDYYRLLGVPPTASLEDLARARRELTSRLHPDHFTSNLEQQNRAQQQLVMINQAFTDVLRQDGSRKMYDQLCRFREKYHRIVEQEGRALEMARTKLSTLHTNMRKARFPLPLLEELISAVELIDLKLESADD